MMRKPNFIVIMTDDQGYGDLSCMGCTDFKTPHFDRLAQNGVRFTSFYANAPVCSPTRASLMTGCYPRKTGVTGLCAGNRYAEGIRKDLPVLSEELKNEGYKTALFGKWHLGSLEECRPHRKGFDKWIGFLAGNVDFFSHVFYYGWTRKTLPIHDLWEDGVETNKYIGKYFTEVITEKSVEFIRESNENDEPFFLFASYNAPHYPMQAPDKYLDRFKNLPEDRRIMAGMLSAVDDGVGAIMDELERLGITESTCIVFQSDNGPERSKRCWLDGNEDYYYGGEAGKLRGHKASLFEGGIRVPAIISWPGTIPCGVVSDEVAATFDIFPSFLKAAGADISKYHIDGKDIIPHLSKGEKNPHDKIFFEMPDQSLILDGAERALDHQYAVRKGDWKLVVNGTDVAGVDEEDRIFLSNIKEDMGERTNLKDWHPEIVQELMAEIEGWKEEIENYKTIDTYSML